MRDRLRVWIDLDNTPHTPFFRPIVRELRERGHEVVVTARADGRTVQLARLFDLAPEVVGGWRARQFPLKVVATLWRTAQLTAFGAFRHFDVAVSHGSRPLILAARALRVPVLTLYDYEGVAVGLYHRLSHRVLVPAAVAATAPARARDSRLVSYDGVKEQVYLSDFRPREGVREELGAGDEDVVALLRPEAESAHYHPTDRRPLMEAVLSHFASHPRLRLVLVPREAEQAHRLGAVIDSLGMACIIPEAVDGRDLIWAADLVVGGGGTMTREAAVLGVPSYSIFQGTPGAVDRTLETEGRLVVLRDPGEVARIRLERRPSVAPLVATGHDLRDFVVDEICDLGSRGTTP